MIISKHEFARHALHSSGVIGDFCQFGLAMPTIFCPFPKCLNY